MKKLFLTMFALGAAVAGQAETVTIQHVTAGAMADELAACGTATNAITELVIQGEAEVTADDFTAIRTLSATLQKLDLSAAVFPKNIMPNGASVNNGVLNRMAALTHCVLPETMTRLGDGAFVACPKLVSVNIPEQVKMIPTQCFNACKMLTDITLPSGLTSIGDQAFKSCEKLKLSEFPETVQALNSQAFNGCVGVTLSKLPDSLTKLKDRALANTSVTISTLPTSLENIETGVFAGVKTITEFEIPDVVNLWTTIPNAFFYIANDAVKRTFVCRSMTPPAANTTLTTNGSFSNVAEKPNTTFKVPYKALEAYKAVAPYSTMNLQPITVPVAITVERPEDVDIAHVAVALVVEDVEHTDFTQEVIEGEGKLTVGFADEAAENLYVKSISRSVTADVNLLADGNWETVYSCDKPEEALKQTVELPLTVDGNMGEYHVEIAAHGNGDTAIRDIQAASSEAGELYDMAGRRVTGANGLKHGVYLLRTHETVVKIVK